ncbi:LptF/LptG family permease [Qipengyuania sp.]|uniref:LptF/LptG family permease n=1 Tax=Qipengyuania sp. TaxID=2004515 RepID=UPI003AF969FF
MKLLRTLDIYLLRLSCGTLGSVVAIVMSLMVLEHLPRLIDITNLSGHRGYIIGQTVLGLLPEYAGIGAVFGLFLAIALTVRKLALRGELDAIEAMGIAPLRWLRMPIVFTVATAAFVLVNQGWLMPAGERKIDEIGRRMAAGDFGYNLSAHEFHAIDEDTMLSFDGIDPDDGRLLGLFVRTKAGTFQAASGRLALASDKEGILQLRQGQLVEPAGRVMSFSTIDVRLPRAAPPRLGPPRADKSWQGETIMALMSAGDPAQMKAACVRLLWVGLTLLVPFLAVSSGRPPMRSGSPLGVFLGLCIIVALIKSIDWYGGLNTSQPVSLAALIAGAWVIAIVLVPRWQGSTVWADRMTEGIKRLAGSGAGVRSAL